jgi:transaldolase
VTGPGELSIKIYADGADRDGMLASYRNPLVRGFTTNPTLMRQAGVRDYEAFARDILQSIPDRPISFEVFADEFDQMERQARLIAGWGEQVFVKIPITNTRGESSCALVERLAHSGVQVNVTALLALDQVRTVARAVAGGAACYVSVFAGRVADTGRDPLPLMAAALQVLRSCPNAELLWGSPRELLNIFQADAIGCHIITVTQGLLQKLNNVGRDLEQFSLETVDMFFRDARAAGYRL